MALYTPRTHREDDPAALRAFVAAHPFATLVSAEGGVVSVTHLPLLLDAARGPHGTLVGHLARANDHGRALERAGEAVAIFHGPSAYVSATWYAPPTSISTWNYAVVHVRGPVRVLHDPETIRAHVHALALTYEAPEMLDTPGYDDRQLRALVGVELEVTAFEGKFKLSQNRSNEDQARVVEHLAASDQPGAQATAALMRARGAGGAGKEKP